MAGSKEKDCPRVRVIHARLPSATSTAEMKSHLKHMGKITAGDRVTRSCECFHM